MEREIIEIEPTIDDRFIIKLYGQEFEIDKKMFIDNVAEIKQFGKIYEIHKLAKKKSSRKKLQEEEKIEEPIETEI